MLGACEVAEPLKAASIEGRLSDWTRQLTTAVVQACEKTGRLAAAKGHRLALLPKVGQKYLGLDVMAFASPSRIAAVGGGTLVLLGSRGEGDTFPHGFFKVWRLDPGVTFFKKTR